MFQAPRLLTGLALTSALLLTSCGSFFSELEQNLSGESGDELVYEDTYSATDSLNRYIDLLNAGHDNVSWFEDDLYYMEDDISYYDPGVYEPTFYCYFDVDSFDTTLEYDVTNPTGLTATETADLVPQAEALYATLNSLETLCGDITAHVTAQDYKDDDFTALYEKMDASYALIDTYYTQHNDLLEDVDAYFETYDTWEVDLSDPVSVGLDNMDKDIESAEAILDLVEVNYYADTTEGVAAQLQTMYDTLSAAGATHSSYETNDTMSYYYDSFYTELDQNYLPTVKRAIRNFEAADITSVGSDYSDLLDSYNYLVDDYNYYLDASQY